MTERRTPIEPSMKVATLLREYPELEEVLIGIAPPFRKLRNPVLRRSVAKVASLGQAAAVAQIPVRVLIDELRAALGQRAPLAAYLEDRPPDADTAPDWVARSTVVATVDGDDIEERMPVLEVLEHARKLGPDEMVELRTEFLPAPGIDLMRQRGFRVWSRFDGPSVVRTFVAPPDD